MMYTSGTTCSHCNKGKMESAGKRGMFKTDNGALIEQDIIEVEVFICDQCKHVELQGM